MGNAREILASILVCESADRKQYMRDYMRNRYHSVRDRVMKELGGKCVRCGSKKDLQFDHIKKSKKSLRMADIHSVSDARLLDELKNIQILCRKCHSNKSHEAWDFDTPKPRHGTYWMYRKHKCRCPKCVKAFRARHLEWKRNRSAFRIDELIKLAGRWGAVIRGEWWIDEYGSSIFADQDIGDEGHEVIAADYMLNKDALLQGLKKLHPEMAEHLEDQYGGDDTGASAIFFNESIPDNVGIDAAGGAQQWQDIKNDIRLAFVKYHNAILAINTDFWVWVLDQNAIGRIQNFITEEADVNPQATDDITIEEASSKKTNSMPIGEFLDIKYPAQFWRIERQASEAKYLHHEMPIDTLADVLNEGLLPEEHDGRIYVELQEPESPEKGNALLRFTRQDIQLKHDDDNWYTPNFISPSAIDIRVQNKWVPLLKMTL